MKTLTFADYQAIEAVNFSTLKHLDRSPLAYKHATGGQVKDTDAMAKGRMAHCLVFEPDEFPRRYVIWPATKDTETGIGGRRSGKVWDEFCLMAAGREVVKEETYDDCLAIRNAVHRHPEARKILRSGRFEVPLIWTDRETHIRCKARCDWVRPRAHLLADLKTTSDIDAFWFGRDAARRLYHGQAAFYIRGLSAVFGGDWSALIIAVESEAPHDVAVYEIDLDALWAGDQKVHELLARLHECRATRRWPGRYPSRSALRLPDYLYEQADAEYELMGLKPAKGGS